MLKCDIIRKKGDKKMKNERGITLIALVITIIIVILITGVSINMGLGENHSIIKEITEESQQKVRPLYFLLAKEKIKKEKNGKKC